MHDTGDIERFYDAIAPEFDADYYGPNADPCIEFDVRAFERTLSVVLDRHNPETALEIGSGSGHWLEWLEQRGVSASGVDVSAKMCAVARNRGLQVFQGEASNLPVPSSSYDLVVSPYCALDHAPDYRRAFSEIDRVARGKAIAVLMVDNSERFISRYWRVRHSDVKSIGSDPRRDGRWLHEVSGEVVAVHTKLFCESEIRALMPGWQVQVIGIGLLTPLIPRWLRAGRSRRLLKLVLVAVGPIERQLCRRYQRRAALSVYIASRGADVSGRL